MTDDARPCPVCGFPPRPSEGGGMECPRCWLVRSPASDDPAGAWNAVAAEVSARLEAVR